MKVSEMNKQASTTRIIFVAISAALIASTATAQTLKVQSNGPDVRLAPIQQMAVGPQSTAAAIDPNDAYDTVLQKKCNKAGGGMSTDETGNYVCTSPSGEDIPDY